MAMRRTEHIRSRGVDGAMDHKRRRVKQSTGAAVNHGARVVDLDQIRGLDLRECDAERVHPESCGVDGVAEGDVAGDACIIS